MTRRRFKLPSRRMLDASFGTIVRYLGVGFLVYGAGVDRFKNPAIIPAAMGMIFFKNVAQGGRNGDGE